MAALSAYQSISSGITQAGAQQAAVDERLRRMQAAHAQTLGEGGAIEGASGLVKGASSLSMHLAQMNQEFRRQEAWTRDTGGAAADATMKASWWNGITDIAGGIFKAGAAGNWGAPPPSVTGAGASYDPLSSLAQRSS
jgi:hypothetical protein